jgi:hypothetical protein
MKVTLTPNERIESKKSELMFIEAAINNLIRAKCCQFDQGQDNLSERSSRIIEELKARFFDLRDELEVPSNS